MITDQRFLYARLQLHNEAMIPVGSPPFVDWAFNPFQTRILNPVGFDFD